MSARFGADVSSAIRRVARAEIEVDSAAARQAQRVPPRGDEAFIVAMMKACNDITLTEMVERLVAKTVGA